MKKQNIIYLIFVVIIVILIGVAVIQYRNAWKLVNDYHTLDSYPFTTTVELYEIENPNFNAEAICKSIIKEEYPSRKCTFDWGTHEYLPLGSKIPCIINCI